MHGMLAVRHLRPRVCAGKGEAGSCSMGPPTCSADRHHAPAVGRQRRCRVFAWPLQATAEHYGAPESPYAHEAHRQALEQAQAQGAGEAAAGQQQAFVPGTGADAEAAAASFFDAAVHQQYLDLPAWPQPTEAELRVRRRRACLGAPAVRVSGATVSYKRGGLLAGARD